MLIGLAALVLFVLIFGKAGADLVKAIVMLVIGAILILVSSGIG